MRTPQVPPGFTHAYQSYVCLLRHEVFQGRVERGACSGFGYASIWPAEAIEPRIPDPARRRPVVVHSPSKKRIKGTEFVEHVSHHEDPAVLQSSWRWEPSSARRAMGFSTNTSLPLERPAVSFSGSGSYYSTIRLGFPEPRPKADQRTA